MQHKGPPLEQAPGVIILLHGRGASADSMWPLYEAWNCPTLAALAPQAPDHTWYPYPFMSPLEANQPHLDHALDRINVLYRRSTDADIPAHRIALCGFSQGACLVAEYALRHPRRYGALMILAGGFIGPPGTSHPAVGSFEKTPVFIGVSDPDSHIPLERAQATADVFSRMGAETDFRRYPGLPHAIHEDEILATRALIQHWLTP